MAEYKKSEARDWAKSQMHGVANVIIPTFTQDLKALNERAIRHDVRKEIEFGFWGALLVSETATTVPEYGQFAQWAVDEGRGNLRLIHHASFNTLEENIEAVKASERAGADLVLLSYPANFYPESAEDVFEYTRAFCEQTDLGVIIFPVPLWGFERLHPAGIPPAMIDRMVEEIPNIVAVKAEGGMPTIAGFAETWRKLSDKVVVTFPIEDDAIPLAMLVNMQFMGTSDSEYYGPMVPRMFNLVREGNIDQAMALYWQIHPARVAHISSNALMKGTNFVHRMLWKYEGWLNGFNGGPLRAPTMRLVDSQMKALRQGLIASGLEITPDPDSEFYVGRNPA
ncbi:MAG: dihydrodipicolinate synthase family protein [Dehalococcoidia bacterium]|nr:dihydrodipicolinate synthase family protein [Dehalococcoidia bacterium]